MSNSTTSGGHEPAAAVAAAPAAAGPAKRLGLSLATQLVFGNLIGIALIAILVAGSLLSSRAAHVDRAEDATANVARVLSEEIHAEVRRVDLALQALAHAYARSGARTVSEKSALLPMLVDLHSALSEADSLRVTDANGIVRIGRGAEAPPPVDLSDRPYFAAVRRADARTLVVSEPLIGRFTQKWVIVLARPLRNADGSFAGMVYGNLSSEHLASMFGAINLGDDGAISLRSGTMALIARRTPQGLVQGELGTSNVSEQLRAAIARNPESGNYVAVAAIDRVERANAYQRVADLPLYVIVGLGTSEFLAPWVAQAWQTIGLSLLLALSMAGASWLIHLMASRQAAVQQKLRSESERNRTLLMTATDGIHVLGTDGSVIEHNDAFAAMLGRGGASLRGQAISALDAARSATEIAQWLRGCRPGETQRFKTRYRHAGGSLIDAELTCAGMRIDQRDVVYCSARDVTESSARERALRELTSIFDNTSDFVVQVDVNGRITYLNPAARRAIGLGADEPLGARPFRRYTTRESVRQLFRRIVPAVATSGIWLGETTLRLPGRPAVPVSQLVIAHRDADGRIERYSAVIRDISPQVEAQHELLRQSATLRLVAESIPSSVAVVGRDRRYRFANTAFQRWCGLPPERIIGHDVREVLGEREYALRHEWVERALAGEAVNFVLDYPSAGGTHSHYVSLSYVPLPLEDGTIDGFVGVTTDITPLKLEELRLLHLSRRDPLTGVLNRTGLEGYFDAAGKSGPDALFGLLYVDLDRFKPVNDHYGHFVGDQLLQIFAKRLTNLVRPTDAVARMGGDEFLVVLADLDDAAVARLVAEKVLDAARAPFEVGGVRITIGASVGVAVSRDLRAGWRDVIARADRALLAAKSGGRGRAASAHGDDTRDRSLQRPPDTSMNVPVE